MTFDDDDLKEAKSNFRNSPHLMALLARLEAAESYAEEQARLLGMSGSREAKLLTEIERLREALDRISGITCTCYAAGIARSALDGEKRYPCEKCGKLRTQDEGGTTFTVCDACWDGGKA